MDANAIDVLLIEDSPGDARLIQEMLAETHRTPFALERVDRLSSGLDRIASRPPDVVLLDLGLPDAKGLEGLGAIQRQAARVPVVVLTGLDDEDVAARAVQEGAQDYLVKGQIDDNQLSRAIRYAIGRKQTDEALRQSQDRLQTIIANTPIILFATDREGRMTTSEGRGLQGIGVQPGQVNGRSIFDLFAGQQDILEIMRRGLAGEEVTSTVEIDGRAFDLCMGPLREGKGDVCGILGVCTDITERVRAEEALHTTLQELEARNQELESFTYSVSHDLKEPLRTVEAFSQFLLEDYAGRLDEQGKDYLHRMGKASGRLKQMIEELLALSRLGRRPEELVRVDPGQVVADIGVAFHTGLEEKNASIEVEGELPCVLGDMSRVEQTFGNLIANGIKFNRSERPLVTVGVQDVRNGAATFFVRDNGIGIDPQYHDKIFGVFQRLHRREEYDGTGAGLAIVKRAVEALGGRVWVDSAPDAGTTFFVSLPLWQEAAIAA